MVGVYGGFVYAIRLRRRVIDLPPWTWQESILKIRAFPKFSFGTGFLCDETIILAHLYVLLVPLSHMMHWSCQGCAILSMSLVSVASLRDVICKIDLPYPTRREITRQSLLLLSERDRRNYGLIGTRHSIAAHECVLSNPSSISDSDTRDANLSGLTFFSVSILRKLSYCPRPGSGRSQSTIEQL
jgi:hypothetical protein